MLVQTVRIYLNIVYIVNNVIFNNHNIYFIVVDSMSVYIDESEFCNDIHEWKGMSMNEIRKGCGTYEYQEHPPIVFSAKHTVLFRVYNFI